MTLKIGILIAEPQLSPEVWRNSGQIALEQAQRCELLDHDIEFVEVEADGLPFGSTQAVIDAWKRLEREGVVAIVGPAAADNAMAIRELADTQGIATLSTTATSYFPNEWCFSVSWGSSPEDAYRMVDWLRSQGASSMAIVRDDMWHSGEFVEFLRIAGRQAGLRITAEERIAMPLRKDGPRHDALGRTCEAIANLRSSQPDSLAVATTITTAMVGHALRRTGWQIPVVCNNSLGAGRDPRTQGAMDGWVGTSVYDERNIIGQRYLDEYEQRHGPLIRTDFQLSCHDAFRVLFEGLALAPIMTRQGVRKGLERVRMLPSSMGTPGTYLGLGEHDHRALKGKDATVLRRLTPNGGWDRIDDIAHISLAID
ncbi:ABC-type branched-subunit amino acid transport system substrate-binding protein [Pseudomonas sp. JAI111]|uniref:ABC transporter substrate-binding protein n=1 Tax=Pseudomonas sp. JAI111 TaxID=2735913 RepID=UPI002169D088|nr:ABC transporter substrate-binding protein [Pseudomonas sp. JAI111]MCS3835675.1 ABC-type branched-subunit amino acid transport system substrate-binding protein [Pseudomonas sp. JAI111]